MRILMLNNEFPPLGGGQGVFNQLLLQHIANHHRNIRVDLITASRSKAEYSSEKFADSITIHRVPVDNIDLHHARGVELIRYALRAERVARRLASATRFDLCLAYSAVPAGVVALWLRLRFGIPYITRSPGVDIPGFEARYRWLYPFLRLPIRYVWRNATRNIVSSNENAALMSAVEPRARPLVIPNGVDTELFKPRQLSRGDANPRILCVARLVKRKGVEVLINAMRKVIEHCPGARLTIVGTGDEEFWLQELARGLGLEESVEFLGAVERAKMPRIYQEADVFVLPSENEGMSNAALEALASGLPLILTDVGGSADLVTSGDNGWIVGRGDSQAIADRISTLIMNPAQRSEMGIRSRERSYAFDIKKMLDRYLTELSARTTG